MAPKAKLPSFVEKALAKPGWTPPLTLEERLQQIVAMGQRIDGYIQFMNQIADLNGTSAEAKEKAVTAFYERMEVVVGQLGRIQEDLRLE